MTDGDLSQKISALSVRLENLSTEFAKNPARAPKILSDALENLNACIEDLKTADIMLKLHRNEHETQNGEKKLEDEIRYRELFNNIRSGVAIYKAINNGNDFIIQDLNKAGERFDGECKDDIIGKSILEVRPGVEEFGLFDVLKRVWKTGIPEHYPAAFYKDNRISGWYENYVYKLPSGEIVAVYDNITERKLAEEKLRASEEKYRILFENATFGVFQTSKDGRLLNANTAFAKMYGFETPEEMIAEIVDVGTQLYASPQDRKEVLRILDERGSIGPSVYSVRHRNGTQFWVSLTARAVLDVNDELLYYEETNVNITERKLMEEAFSNSEHKSVSIIEQIRDGIALVDETGHIAEWNSALEKITGLDRASVLGRPLWDVQSDLAIDEIKTSEFIENIRKTIVEILTTGKSFSLDRLKEHTLQRPDGTRAVVEELVSATPTGKGFMICSILRDITERKQAGEALKESEYRLQTAMESANSGMWEWDLQTNKNVWSDQLWQLYGLNPEIYEPSYDSWLASIHPDDREKAQQTVQEAVDKGLELNFEYRVLDKNGEVRWLMSRGRPKRDINGKLLRYIGIVVDITRRKIAEDALKESENLYRAIFENTGTAIVIVEDNTIISLVNSEFVRTLGYSKDEIEGKISWTAFVVEDDLNRMIEQHKLRRRDANSALKSYEFKARDKKGRIRDMLVHVDIIPGTNKSIGSFVDITEIKLVEKALRYQLKFLQQLIDSIPNPIFYKNTKGIYLGCNKAFEAATGYSRDEIVGYTVHDLYPKDLADIYYEADNKLLQDPGVQIYETSIAHADGSRHNVMFSKATYFDTEGWLAGIVGTILDITERKRMEIALEEAKRRLTDIINFLPDPTFVKDAEGRVIAWNHAMEAMTGIKAEGMLEKGDYEYALPFYGEKRPMLIDLVLKPDPEIEKRYSELKRVNGTLVGYVFTSNLRGVGAYVWAVASPIYDSQGKIVGAIESLKDITEQKKIEKDLQASLKEKDVLLKEIHHRVKNNLQIISALLKLQSSNIADENILKIFKDCQNRIKSMALIHENLYRSKDIGKLDFNEYINQMVTYLSQSYGDLSRKIHFKIRSDNVYLNINTAIPCAMIIGELVSNSLKHAFPDGRNGEISVDLSLVGDDYTLVVSDNGVGIKGDLNIEDSKTLGFKLIDGLAKQIDGVMKLDCINGTRCEIHFKGLE